MASKVILWQPVQGGPSQAKPTFIFIDCLVEDVGLEHEEPPMTIRDREDMLGAWLEPAEFDPSGQHE